eukprot:12411769-Karenia_brevis.AAC.1
MSSTPLQPTCPVPAPPPPAPEPPQPHPAARPATRRPHSVFVSAGSLVTGQHWHHHTGGQNAQLLPPAQPDTTNPTQAQASQSSTQPGQRAAVHVTAQSHTTRPSRPR